MRTLMFPTTTIPVLGLLLSLLGCGHDVWVADDHGRYSVGYPANGNTNLCRTFYVNPSDGRCADRPAEPPKAKIGERCASGLNEECVTGGACINLTCTCPVNTHASADKTQCVQNATPNPQPDNYCAANYSATPTQCGNWCVNTNTSMQHCGKCDSPCANNQRCNNGNCVAVNVPGPMCVDNNGCTSSDSPRCSGGTCGSCTDDSDCSRFAATPVCDKPVGRCKARPPVSGCNVDTDCGASDKICRKNACVAKFVEVCVAAPAAAEIHIYHNEPGAADSADHYGAATYCLGLTQAEACEFGIQIAARVAMSVDVTMPWYCGVNSPSKSTLSTKVNNAAVTPGQAPSASVCNGTPGAAEKYNLALSKAQLGCPGV